MASPVISTTWSTPNGVCQCRLHGRLLINSLQCSRSGSEVGEHQSPPAKRSRVHSDADKASFASECECFPVVRYYRRASLCHSPFWNGQLDPQPFLSTTIITASIPSSTPPPSFPVLCSKRFQEEAPLPLSHWTFSIISPLSVHGFFPSLNASSNPHKIDTDPENPCWWVFLMMPTTVLQRVETIFGQQIK